MKPLALIGISAMTICIAAGSALSREAIIYPAKGQSAEQVEKDKYECYTWAKGQTGFDPMQSAQAAPVPKQSEGSVAGGAAKGALGGALLGTGIGAIAGDTGKGAAIGAVAGGALGGLMSQRQKKAQQQVEAEQVAQHNQKRGTYDRAYGACLEGRGYTVK